jgi:hypothetical protein
MWKQRQVLENHVGRAHIWRVTDDIPVVDQDLAGCRHVEFPDDPQIAVVFPHPEGPSSEKTRRVRYQGIRR